VCIFLKVWEKPGELLRHQLTQGSPASRNWVRIFCR
jgi:hypothetical protein